MIFSGSGNIHYNKRTNFFVNLTQTRDVDQYSVSFILRSGTLYVRNAFPRKYQDF